ncbi:MULTISPECIES: YjjG family noncanonical pyrimidine nucleotidase [Bizionia]|uniref:Noncanonical pyrimidine nucleotidase, YjjG family n=1 Tax=Bizionia algoritergicola TaxID=291187 RepID=A0A5D0QNY0_9FLAO|nr:MULTISPECIES: YjjG family noncanonical pyrimidine nucleotidase [Bizionia]OBX22354.1 noncanonical pyrimidine nucleotidase, YjjG family [Bizionia sp. APA-3]TYB70569.1 noncanonical pyrimidine nucleotidase, YjjG family [Bizionia algoritergicola]
MKINGITDIFFDLDHTLWDFDKNSALAFEEIFNTHNIDVDILDFLKVYEPINLSYWKLYRDDQIDKESLRYRRLKESFDAIKTVIHDDVINQLAIDYIVSLPTFNHLFEGTFDLLNYLQPHYQMHIITNGFQEAQDKKMEQSKISKYFKTVTNSELAGVKKPNPIIFDYALNRAAADKTKSLMIGDNLEADVLGALNFGMDAICFNYHGVKIDSNIKQVTNLKELKAYL